MAEETTKSNPKGSVKFKFFINVLINPRDIALLLQCSEDSLPLCFPLVPEEHPCTHWIVHEGLKGYPTKTLILSVAESTPTLSSAHVQLLTNIFKMERLLKCNLTQNSLY